MVRQGIVQALTFLTRLIGATSGINVDRLGHLVLKLHHSLHSVVPEFR